MKPVYWVFAIVLGVSLAAGWTWLQRARETRAESVAAQAATILTAPARVVPIETSQPVPAPEQSAASERERAQWIVDVDSTDAAKRAAAITALAQAPRSQALPVLRRVLLNGDPAVDRPLALQALRGLALRQGDGDTGVRQTFREVIFHGDDESLAASAQEALDVVERSEQKLAQR